MGVFGKKTNKLEDRLDPRVSKIGSFWTKMD
jgi:hypothetical protein